MAVPLREMVVADSLEPCAYLPGQVARLPLRLPLAFISREELDARLAVGERRSGVFFYRTQCPVCHACEPLRIPVDQFASHATQRRTLKRGDTLLETKLGPPEVTPERVALYNAHRRGRGLARSDRDLDAEGLREFLVDSRCESFEMRYTLADKLVGVAVVDRGAESLSAVYTYFNPEHARLSLGSYSVLKQIELAQAWGMKYLYLGLFIAASPHMSYKKGYLPHERLIAGAWVRFEE